MSMIFPNAYNIISTAFKQDPQSITKNLTNITGISNPSEFIPLLDEYLDQMNKNLTNHLIILPNEEACQSFSKHLNRLNRQHFLFLNPSPQPYSDLVFSTKTMLHRIKCFYLAQKSNNHIFISHPAALSLFTLSPEDFKKATVPFEYAESFFENPTERLSQLGYQPTPFVEQPGQFSEKGGIIDLFSPAEEHPVRLSLFGHEIESIHHYSVETQRNLIERDSFTLVPASECFYTDEGQKKLLHQLHSSNILEHQWKIKALDSVRNKKPFDKMNLFMNFFWSNAKTGLSYFKNKNTRVICFDYRECEKVYTHYKKETHNDFEFLEANTYKKICTPNTILKDSFSLKDYSSIIDLSPVSIEDISLNKDSNFISDSNFIKDVL